MGSKQPFISFTTLVTGTSRLLRRQKVRCAQLEYHQHTDLQNLSMTSVTHKRLEALVWTISILRPKSIFVLGVQKENYQLGLPSGKGLSASELRDSCFTVVSHLRDNLVSSEP